MMYHRKKTLCQSLKASWTDFRRSQTKAAWLEASKPRPEDDDEDGAGRGRRPPE